MINAAFENVPVSGLGRRETLLSLLCLMLVSLLNASTHTQSLSKQLSSALLTGIYLKPGLAWKRGCRSSGPAVLPPAPAAGRRQGGMAGAAQERWAGGWPVGPKSLAAQEVRGGLWVGSCR